MRHLICFVMIAIACVSAGLNGCGSSSASQFDNAQTYFSTMTNLTVDVFYEPNAAPYTGTIPPEIPAPFGGRNYWDVTEENLKALFEGRPTSVTITVPKEIAAMTPIEAQSQSGWTIDEIEALWGKYRKNLSTATHGYFFLAFVDGYYERDGAQQQNVIGVNVSGTPVTILFKRVIEAAGEGTRNYVEQSTVIHELGHVLGLVNLGIPLASAHHDANHGAHCTNTSCVMHYLNEGVSDMESFVQNALVSGTLVMFKQDCLDDARNYRP